jgi:alpha/beta superfamily hydrolase
LLLFDFAGSGESDGEYVTLGYNESNDLVNIVNDLKKRFSSIKKIILWGRSMGAVTALMYAKKVKFSKTVKGMIVDSPFSSLKKLA